MLDLTRKQQQALRDLGWTQDETFDHLWYPPPPYEQGYPESATDKAILEALADHDR